MNRRTLLRRTAAAGVAVSLAGCLGGDDEEPVLTVPDDSYVETEDGDVAFDVTVSNPSDRAASGTLYVNVSVDDEALTRVREVSLDPHETVVVRVDFDIPADEATNITWSTDIVED